MNPKVRSWMLLVVSAATALGGHIYSKGLETWTELVSLPEVASCLVVVAGVVGAWLTRKPGDVGR